MLLFAQPSGNAQVTDQCLSNETVDDCIPYTRSFLIPGDYAVAGIDLTHQNNPPVNNFSTGEIVMSGVPYDADILAAYLYWETIHFESTPSQAEGVEFRDQPISFTDVEAVKRSQRPLNDSTAQCFSSGTPLTMSMFRADVLRFLPIRKDANDRPTGKRLVNTADLVAHGETGLKVRLPVRSGNQLPESAGASLLVVYRSPDPNAPLRSIVIYDGIWVQPSTSDAMVRTIAGFYQADETADARLTHITGSGQPNGNERILFDGPGVGANTVVAQMPPDPQEPFFGGTASQRAWATKTIPINEALMDSAASIAAETVGEQATTTVDHVGGGSYDCLSWGAVIFSTKVADEDGDGLPDAVEDTAGGLIDPTGVPLDDFNAMGASSSWKDIFIEVNAMEADPNTPYGGVPDPDGHNHLPTPEVLRMVGEAYAAQGIHAHFDVGNIDPLGPYRSLGTIQHSDWVDDYTSNEANTFLIPTTLARGGEIVKEVACPQGDCLFPDWPGTVSWKLGLQLIRDLPVADLGQELQASDFDTWESGGTCSGVPCQTHRRRFDRVRRGLFHYLLYAHARGRPKSPFPCLVNGDPAPYPPNQTSCTADNPDYHKPASTSGVADQPGGNAMVTLGLWDEYVGRPYVRAATTFHELGHNLNLWHGGRPAIWGDKAPPLPMLPSATYIEPNCKPNYLSSMSYMYQAHGLFGDDQSLNINYSTQSHPAGTDASINETSLSDEQLSPTPLYRPAWYAPADSDLATAQDVSKATRFCGARFFSTTLDGNMNPNTEKMGLTHASGLPLPPTPFHVAVDSEIILVTSCNVSQSGTSCSVTRAQEGTTAAAHANATLVTVTYIPGMARVVADTTITSINWDGAITEPTPTANQDVNYDNNPAPYIAAPDPGVHSNAVLFGVDDWSNVRLNQIGAGRNYTVLSTGSGDLLQIEGDLLYVEGDLLNIEGDLLYVEGDLLYVEGDLLNIEGDLLYVEGDLLNIEGDLLYVEGVDIGGQESPQTLEGARAAGRTAPSALTACIIGEGACKTVAGPNSALYHRVELNWTPTTFDPAVYIAERKVLGASDNTYVPVTLVACPDPAGPAPAPVNCAIDTAELPVDVAFTYRLKATFNEAPPESGWSLPADTATPAFNNAPVGANDPYDATQSTQLTKAASEGVLINDSDNDSPACAACPLNPSFSFKARRAELRGPGAVVPATNGLQTTTTAGGTIVLRFDGSFTFTPKQGYTGPDSFTYRADDGVWPVDGTTKLSAWTSDITVNITVKKKGK